MHIKFLTFALLSSLLTFNAFGEILILKQDSREYQECAKLIPNPINKIEIILESPKIDHSLSARKIAELRKKLVGFSDTKNHGMTYANLRHTYDINGKARKMADGKTCLQISLSGKVKFEKFIIYIENKYPESSCAYREILKHEQLHVAHYQSSLEKIRIEVLNTFKEKYEGKVLIFEGDDSIEALAKELGDYTNRRFKEILNFFLVAN